MLPTSTDLALAEESSETEIPTLQEIRPTLDLVSEELPPPAVACSPAFKATLATFAHVTSPSKPPSLPSGPPSPKPRRLLCSQEKRTFDDLQSESPSKRHKLEKRAKASKRTLGYAPPETYAHLDHINDCVKPELDILFCGINPGKLSATLGHHFAHPTNQFWRALHQSGLTDRLLHPSEDVTLPDRYNYGLTNLVARPSSSATELSKAEKVAGVPELLHKIVGLRPRIVCFIGREIACAVEAAIKPHVAKPRPTSAVASSISEPTETPRDIAAGVEAGTYISPLVSTAPGFRMMDYKLVYESGEGDRNWNVMESLFFVAPSTSGRVTAYQLKDRVQLFQLLLKEKDDVISGSRDTGGMIVIPSSVYASIESPDS